MKTSESACSRLRRALLATLGLCVAGGAFAAPLAPPKLSGPEAAMAQAGTFARSGHFGRAIENFSEAVAGYASSGPPARHVEALLGLAESRQAVGAYREAAQNLETALALTEGPGFAAQRASVRRALGNVYIALGRPEEAQRQLERGLALPAEARMSAAILNDLGNLHAFEGRLAEAASAYTKSVEFARQAGARNLEARALANAARAALREQQPARARSLADSAVPGARALENSHEKAVLLTNLARSYGALGQQLPDAAAVLRVRSLELLREAEGVAVEIGDARSASYALGYMGALYEESARFAEALQLTRRAIYRAGQADAPESLYLWHWQAGRLLEAQAERGPAIQAYQRAVARLQEIRHQMGVGYGSATVSFRDSVGPVYFELVDLLLRSAAGERDPARAQEILHEARNTLELLKAAELRDYFRDECVDALRSRVTTLERASTSAAVVYPILLPDRAELLVSLPSGEIRRFVTRVGAATVTREVRAFRRLLEKRTTREYLPHAQTLHAWLIAPFAGELAEAGVDTLVFVPDGPLRTIPMAALHDGERFLIESYAVATTPGLELTDPRPLDRENLKPLMVGLSKSIAGFPPLANVAEELESVQKLYGGDILIDEQFRLGRMKVALADQTLTVLHIATHAEFSADASDSFLLAYDGRLTMDRLADYVGMFRFRDRPLELLTLSACETAQGDDRAALGLSGVAIQAGARSALGTLWKVNDIAAAELVVEFYGQLQHERLSRAQALQRAQLGLLETFRFRHPGYWSAFLLISNWL